MTCLVYHRGGGKSLGYPPNALPTIKWAVSHGAKAIEFDVTYCDDGKDGTIIVMEPALLKKHGVDIDDVKAEDIPSIDAGSDKTGFTPIATLQDVIDAVPEHIGLQVHIKGNNPKTVPKVLSTLGKRPNTLISSFDINILHTVHKNDSTAKTGWIIKPDNATGLEQSDLTAKVSSGAIELPAYNTSEIDDFIDTATQANVHMLLLCGPRIQSPDHIDKIRKSGFSCGAWGVAQNLTIAKQLISLGLDRFTIDNPEALD